MLPVAHRDGEGCGRRDHEGRGGRRGGEQHAGRAHPSVLPSVAPAADATSAHGPSPDVIYRQSWIRLPPFEAFTRVTEPLPRRYRRLSPCRSGLARLLLSLPLLLVLDGFVLAGWVVRVPAVEEQTGTSASGLGPALFGVSAGAVVIMVFTGRLCPATAVVLSPWSARSCSASVAACRRSPTPRPRPAPCFWCSARPTAVSTSPSAVRPSVWWPCCGAPSCRASTPRSARVARPARGWARRPSAPSAHPVSVGSGVRLLGIAPQRSFSPRTPGRGAVLPTPEQHRRPRPQGRQGRPVRHVHLAGGGRHRPERRRRLDRRRHPRPAGRGQCPPPHPVIAPMGRAVRRRAGGEHPPGRLSTRGRRDRQMSMTR